MSSTEMRDPMRAIRLRANEDAMLATHKTDIVDPVTFANTASVEPKRAKLLREIEDPK